VEFDHFNDCSRFLVQWSDSTGTYLELRESDELFSLIKNEKPIQALKFSDVVEKKVQNYTVTSERNELRDCMDTFKLLKDEELGDLKCAFFLNAQSIIIGTANGWLIIIDIKSRKFVSELHEQKNNFRRKLKVLNTLRKIFFNKDRSLCVVSADDSDSFSLVNLQSFEVIHTSSLNREQFFINCVSFNPFFSMTNSELRD